MLENLLILLTDEDKSASRSSVAEIVLPTNEDALKIVQSDDPKNLNNWFDLTVSLTCNGCTPKVRLSIMLMLTKYFEEEMENDFKWMEDGVLDARINFS